MEPILHKKGFTLIELLVVIAIIGILSAIGLVALNGNREGARDAQRKSDLSSLRTSLALYFDDSEGQYPDVTSEITKNADGTTSVTGGFDTIMVPKYIGALLAPPRAGGGPTDTYTYLSGGTLNPLKPSSEFRLYVQLEKSTAGTGIFFITEGGTTSTANTAPTCNPVAATPPACTTPS